MSLLLSNEAGSMLLDDDEPQKFNVTKGEHRHAARMTTTSKGVAVVRNDFRWAMTGLHCKEGLQCSIVRCAALVLALSASLVCPPSCKQV